MDTRLLILGGSSFVGRALVESGLDRGWEVTTFNRGRGWADPRVRRLHGDRLHPRSLSVLDGGEWDLTVDTWAGAPSAVRDSTLLLRERTARYAYISSCSVYAPPPPIGGDESAATVDAAPDAGATSYPADKRGAEMAVQVAFGESALLARAGLILGPHEDVGRLPWWLRRVALGGEILAPGPPDLPLQLVDARDLADFVLDATLAGHHGPFNVVSRRGHATMGSLLEDCLRAAGAPDARLTWVTADVIASAGIEAWTDLPIWLPPDHPYAGMQAIDVERAHAAGLRCRPVGETVADTWSWLSSLTGPAPLRTDRPAPGLEAARERAALAAWHRTKNGPL